jgi:Cof subfamily protein (haloacid dehalogenase superfamily)
MQNYKLVALDLDGTLFDNQSRITADNLAEIRRVTAAGAHVVISTGRPFCGLPFSQIQGSGIEYSINTNGSSIYRLCDQTCIYEDSMPPEMILPILDYLLGKDIHFDLYIDGKAYSPTQCVGSIQKLAVPESIRSYIRDSRIRIPDMPGFIRENNYRVQKITMNFSPDENGVLKEREEIRHYFESRSDVTCVCGGYNNLEISNITADKGSGLCHLAEHLDIPIEETIAIGDSENDLAIIRAAGLGIAMANATDVIRAAAGDITLSNEESGVAASLRKYFPA